MHKHTMHIMHTIMGSNRVQRTVSAAAVLAFSGVAAAIVPTPSQDPPRNRDREVARDTDSNHKTAIRNGGSSANLADMRRVADAMRENNITLDRVIAAAEGHVKGTAVEARSRLERDMPVVDVSVLDSAGQMSTVCVDARNARVLEVFGGSAGTDGDRHAVATAIVKGTEVVGKKVIVSGGEKVGRIHDLALDTTNRRIAYAIVELDEVNDSYFAVPWSALRCDGEHATIEGLDRQRLRGAPSFARATWPRDWNDTQFRQSLATYYSRQPYGDQQSGGAMRWEAMKASEMFGRNVENTADENIGEIEDLAIDPSTGRIAYAVLSFGGFLGFNDKFFAVPLEALTHQSDGTCRLAVDKDRLKDAPGFDKKNWPRTGNATFDTQVRDFYRDGNRDTTRTPTRQ